MDEYRCAACGGVFEKGWTEDEARGELADTFAIPVEDCEIVCDDCYNEIMDLPTAPPQ